MAHMVAIVEAAGKDMTASTWLGYAESTIVIQRTLCVLLNWQVLHGSSVCAM
jgi:hypothetical protein